MYSSSNSNINFLDSAIGLFSNSAALVANQTAYGNAVQSLQDAGAAAMSIANYNKSIEQYNLNKTLDGLARQTKQLMGTQKSQLAYSGADLMSGSSLAILSESMGMAERQAIELREASRIKQDTIIYAGELQRFQLQNEAMAKYNEGKAKSYALTLQVAQNLFNTLSQFQSMGS